MTTNDSASGVKDAKDVEERILPQHDPKEKRPVTVGAVIITILWCLLFFGIMYACSLLVGAFLSK